MFTGKKENLNPAATFYKVDIRSQEIETIIEKERPEVINHHAAQISVPASVKCPFSFYFTRVKNQVKKIISVLSAPDYIGAGRSV